MLSFPRCYAGYQSHCVVTWASLCSRLSTLSFGDNADHLSLAALENHPTLHFTHFEIDSLSHAAVQNCWTPVFAKHHVEYDRLLITATWKY